MSFTYDLLMSLDLQKFKFINFITSEQQLLLEDNPTFRTYICRLNPKRRCPSWKELKCEEQVLGNFIIKTPCAPPPYDRAKRYRETDPEKYKVFVKGIENFSDYINRLQSGKITQDDHNLLFGFLFDLEEDVRKKSGDPTVSLFNHNMEVDILHFKFKSFPRNKIARYVKNTCKSLKRNSAVLSLLPLQLRSMFALLSPLVPSSYPMYPLAQAIDNATHCKMTGKTIVSWNIDSLRAGIVDKETAKCKHQRKILKTSPMGRVISEVNPDIICLQETKLKVADIKCFNIEGFYTNWNCSTGKKGYSGVAIWSREKPLKVSKELPGLDESLQIEGRILTAYYEGYVVVNTYVPNTLRAGTKPVRGWEGVKRGKEREATYKHYIGLRRQWDQAVLRHLKRLRKKVRNVIWCGDLNVARSLLDIHNGQMTKRKIIEEKAGKNRASRVKNLSKRLKDAITSMRVGGGAGLRLEEREGIQQIIRSGFSDAYRTLYPNSYGFTYWDRTKIHFRNANNGWRIDYFIVTPNLLPCIESIKVLKDIGVVGRKVPSDHAPIALQFY